MRVLWINPSFLDYRVPVYRELDRLLNGNLTVLYSQDRTPRRVCEKLEGYLGPRAIGLSHERRLRFGHRDNDAANATITIPYQPGLLSRTFHTHADVIIAEGFFQWTPAAVMKALVQRSALVVSYERTRHTERNCPWWRTLYRKAVIPFVDAMLCNGSLCREYAHSLGMPLDRIVTGGMAADSLLFRTSSGMSTEQGRGAARAARGLQSPVFLFAGRMTSAKGILQLVLGWRSYVESGGPGCLVMAGDGPMLPELKQFANDSSIPRLHFLGHIDYPQLPEVYALADVFIIATLEDNWSLVVPEAMACGLPVACSKYNGCWPELIEEGGNGSVFDPLDSRDLLRCLRFFADRQKDLPRMGSRSREIEAQYRPEHAASSALKACEIAMGRAQRWDWRRQLGIRGQTGKR